MFVSQNFVGIDFASDGTFWTVLSIKNHPTGIEDKIFHYKADGTLLQSSGFAPLTTANRPFDLAIDPDGNIYVTAFENFCVAKFDISNNGWTKYLDATSGAGGKGIGFYCGAFTCVQTCTKPNAGTDQTSACNAGVVASTGTLAATAVTGSAWTQVSTNPVGASITNPSAENSGISGLTAGTYNFIWATSATCSDTVQIIVSPCICTSPTVTPTVTQATCNGGTANNDAQIAITVTNGDKFGYVQGATYTAPLYAAATTLTARAGSITGLPNPATATQYTIRVFNGNDNCFIDTTVTLNPKNCAIPCGSPNCGTVTIIKI